MTIRSALVAIATLLTLAGCARLGGEPFQGSLNGVLQLDADTRVTQTFNPVDDTVTGIDLLVATYAEPADPDGTLTVTLTEAGSEEELGQATIDGEHLGDGEWVTARFDDPDPVREVAVLTASWDGATPIALYANTAPTPTVRANQQGLVNDPYPGGEARIDGDAAQGDLAFRVRSDAGPGDALNQVREVVASAGSRLRAQPAFFLLWILALAGCAALIVYGFRRA